MNKQITIYINNKAYNVASGLTLIQACSLSGFEIPRFCYHEKLSIAGNCRMCLVEVSRPRAGGPKPKPVASCAMPVSENMYIHTNTLLVKKARESVLEFLLINHPLDCPICDQGGECDLQDQTIVFGSDRGRFYDNKRAVADKDLGPLIKTVMTRCIHCTRCVRFGNEIAGVDFLGTTGRGLFTEIGTYVNNMRASEISANIIDLCPVGALTSKPYAFMARSWELKSVETIDVLDSMCSNIRIDSRGLDIMRILPRLNEDINEEWITDKTRFSFDGLKKQRLQVPLVKIGGRFTPVSWKSAFLWLGFYFLNKTEYIGITGKLDDCETLIALKDFLNKVGSSNYIVQENISGLNIDIRQNYLLNTKLPKLENVDLCILVGFNPRLELPLLNVRLRKAVKNKNCTVISYGYTSDLTYKQHHVSNNLFDFLTFAEGKSIVCKKFLKSKNPVILKGISLFERNDSLLFSNVSTIFEKLNLKTKNLFNLISINTGTLNALELGIYSNKNFLMEDFYQKNKNYVFFLLGIDNKCMLQNLANIKFKFPKNTLYIYQGHNGNEASDISDVILPSTSYVEQNSTYLNLEGYVQYSKFIKVPPYLGRTGWKILVALSTFINKPLEYTTLSEIRKRLGMISPLFNNNLKFEFFELKNSESFIKKSIVFNTPIVSPFFDFYMTNVISNSSKNMFLTSTRFVNKNQNFLAI